MIVSIHQPQYLPWLGYFEKIAQSDLFVFLDDTQFKKNEWQNRNKIRTPKGWQWLTVPVIHDFGQTIQQTKINYAENWRRKHSESLKIHYGKTPYFDVYFPKFLEILDQEYANLADLNIVLIEWFCREIGITTRFVRSSSLKIPSEKTQRLIDICQTVGADTYLAGAGCLAYLEPKLFEKQKIKLLIQNYQHPEYNQMYTTPQSPFISHLSIMDLLLNCGESSKKILTGE